MSRGTRVDKENKHNNLMELKTDDTWVERLSGREIKELLSKEGRSWDDTWSG